MGERVLRQRLPELASRLNAEESLMRRLMVASPAFRAACEDYLLALDALEAFEAIDEAGQRPETIDYRAMLPELEAEVRGLLEAAARDGRAV